VLQDDEGKVRVLGYMTGGFRIHNGMLHEVEGSMCVTNDLAFRWAVDSPEEITWDSLAFARALNPAPDLLIIGTGEKTVHLDPVLLDRLAEECCLNVESSKTVSAVATFNFLGSQEGRRVAAMFVCLPQSDPVMPNPPRQRDAATILPLRFSNRRK
jgi:uncharacterized protein